MAQPITCDAECEEHADRIITDTATGESLAFCLEHFVVFCIAMGDNARGEAAELADAPTTEPAGGALEPDPSSAPPAAAPKSGKTRTAPPITSPATDQPAPAPPADD